jgi:quercetin dioxygenase-like cupin family protein
VPNDKNYAVLPQQQPLKINIEDSPLLAEAADVDEDEVAMDIRPTILTNDIITTWTEGDPGAVIPWHSHSPEMYQVLVNIKGRCRWEYRDNDGEVQSVEGGPGDVIYLPAGAENRVEVVGDERHIHIGILKRPRVPRIEHLTGELGGLYDPTEFPAALVIDDMNDRVVRKGDGVELNR